MDPAAFMLTNEDRTYARSRHLCVKRFAGGASYGDAVADHHPSGTPNSPTCSTKRSPQDAPRVKLTAPRWPGDEDAAAPDCRTQG